jgi:hypothetical protein
LHIQRPFFKSLCFFVLWGRCRLRGGGTRPPNSKPDQTRCPSPNQSPTGREPESPSPRRSPICFGPGSPSPRRSPICFGPESPSPSPRGSPISVGLRSPMDSGVQIQSNRTPFASLDHVAVPPAVRRCGADLCAWPGRGGRLLFLSGGFPRR